MNAKCSCQSCNEEFEFDVSEFRESARSGDMAFGQDVQCPHCHKETMVYLSLAATVPSYNESLPQASSAKGEQILFQSGIITVTKTRFVIGNAIFAMRNVESIRIIESEEVASNRRWAAPVGLIGGFAIFGVGIAMGFSGDDINVIPIIVSGIIGFAIFIFAVLASNQLKRTYAILLKTGSGDISAYKSFDKFHINNIVMALNEAIASQG